MAEFLRVINTKDRERQDELGLNWDSFKYKNYDYTIGRFMCTDPLAEDYNYQSPYNFCENRVIDGVELEGLERVGLDVTNFGQWAANKVENVQSAISQTVSSVGNAISSLFTKAKPDTPGKSTGDGINFQAEVQEKMELSFQNQKQTVLKVKQR